MVGLRQTLDHLSALYVEGGIEIVTPAPEAADGRPACRTLIQPDGDLIFYVADPVSEGAADLHYTHGKRVEAVIRSLGRLRIVVRGGTVLAEVIGVGFVLLSGLAYFLKGEVRGALWGLGLAAAPLLIRRGAAVVIQTVLLRRFRRRL